VCLVKSLRGYLAIHALNSGATIASVVSGLVDIWLSVLQGEMEGGRGSTALSVSGDDVYFASPVFASTPASAHAHSSYNVG
jgi:hypothetical protein